MKPSFHYSTDAGALALPARRLFPALSPLKRSRQVLARPGLAVVPRAAVPWVDRAYRKAMREAEMAYWNAPRISPNAPATPSATGERLPQPTPEAGEGRVYALLAALCLSVLGCEFWSVFQAAGSWENFVQYVRQLLS